MDVLAVENVLLPEPSHGETPISEVTKLYLTRSAYSASVTAEEGFATVWTC
jgi:hypothetical protein